MTSVLVSANSPHLAAPAISRASTITAAISARERAMFFSQFPVIPDASISFEDTWEMKPTSGALWQEALIRTRPEILISCWSTPPLPIAWLARRDCPLRYVCHLTGSVRELVPRSFLEAGGKVTNWGHCVAPQVAEHALLLTLAALRAAPRWPTLSHEEKLKKTMTLFGKRVGIHGFGRVARALIALLQPFGVVIRVYAHGVPPALIWSQRAEVSSSLKDLAMLSDILIDCEALTAESHGSVSREVLAALPDDGVFVNVGRGRVVDEDALIAEATSGRLRVAVDVVANEPLDPESPLARLPHLIHSPHLAGPTGDRLPDCGRLALENIRRFLLGEPLEAEVTLETYDRST